MGTTYMVTYAGQEASSLHQATDSLLQVINASLSTYIEASLISQFNALQDIGSPFTLDDHFEYVYDHAVEISRATGGAFNPAIAPLINAWGFGADRRQDPANINVDSLLAISRYDNFSKNADGQLSKSVAGAQLNFNAIAKGYGVDAVGELLEDAGIQDYFVEIGGEVRVRGLHPEGRTWRVGIDVPNDEPGLERAIQVAIELQDASMATSGNYRNFYVEHGKKYVHTINPETGHPETSSLLSASVIAKDCMTADAYATAFMVMGVEKALALAESTEGLEAYFISAGGEQGEFSESRTSGFPAPLLLE